MTIFSRAFNSLLVACVLAAGASALGVPLPQRGDKKPPPKEEKVVPKEDKQPRNDDRRNDDRREPPRQDNRGKKGDG